MKKLFKISLILSGIFALVGCILLAISASLGLTWGVLFEEVTNGSFAFGPRMINEVISENTICEFEEIKNLNVDLTAGELMIVKADVEKVRVEHYGFELVSEMEGDTLVVENQSYFNIGKTAGKLIVTVPSSLELDKVEVKVHAGKAMVDPISSKEYEFVVRAGRLNLNLPGVKDDYEYDIATGLGDIQFDNESYSGLGNDRSVKNQDANKKLMVECGIGEINVQFER